MWHMCGRYALSKMADELIEEFEITAGYEGPLLPIDWNIAPTKEIYIVRENRGGKRELATASWGMIAPWSKNHKEAAQSQSRAINARIETVDEKPTFRSAFRSRRCLIPATGYYEWATALGKYEPKQPFYIHSETPDSSLAFAGIFDRWVDDEGKFFESAAIVTRPAESFLAEIHTRMPTILPTERWMRWLDRYLLESQEILSIINLEEPAKGLVAYPVSRRINSNRSEGLGLSERVEIEENSTLF